MAGRHFFITGRPGVGKTSLIKRLCGEISHDADFKGIIDVPRGFVTEEEKINGRRVGFTVVSVYDDARGTLASISSQSRLRVGKYGVEIEKFEAIALKELQIPELGSSKAKLFVIDEIGKMELYSEKFRSQVSKLLKIPNIVILATIPIRGDGLPIVREIRNNPDATIITIDEGNRNDLQLISRIKCEILGAVGQSQALKI